MTDRPDSLPAIVPDPRMHGSAIRWAERRKQCSAPSLYGLVPILAGVCHVMFLRTWYLPDIRFLVLLVPSRIAAIMVPGMFPALPAEALKIQYHVRSSRRNPVTAWSLSPNSAELQAGWRTFSVVRHPAGLLRAVYYHERIDYRRPNHRCWPCWLDAGQLVEQDRHIDSYHRPATYKDHSRTCWWFSVPYCRSIPVLRDSTQSHSRRERTHWGGVLQVRHIINTLLLLDPSDLLVLAPMPMATLLELRVFPIPSREHLVSVMLSSVKRE